MSSTNFEILAYESTPLGLLCLRRRELLSEPGTFVTEITINHEFLMSSHYTASERALAREALALHQGTDLQVLVGGLGLGYTALEALASPRVADVEAMELLPQVIDWLDRGLFPVAEQLNGDTRFSTVPGDVYARLALPPTKKYDLILIDVDHSPDEQLDSSSASFYTAEGLVAAKQHLSPRGVLAVWSFAETSDFAEALKEVFAEVTVIPVTFWSHLVDEEVTDWLFFARD